MTTVDHLIAACGQLRTSWRWLADATLPGRARRNTRHYTDRQQAARNQRAAQERHDRPHLSNAGRIVGGGQPPANLNAVDARTRIAVDVDQLAAELSLAVATVRDVGAHYTNNAGTDARFGTALDWISRNAAQVTDPHLLNDAHRRLQHADRLACTVTGEGPDHRPLAAECIACGRRSLAWDTSSARSEEWHVLCTNESCRCDGRDCACNLPERVPGMAHIWLESMWTRLAAQLKEA